MLEPSTLMNERFETIVRQISSVLIGKEPQVRLALTCMFARGHLLIEDLPGIGKTTMAKVLARCLGLDFQRIQFTSDMLPGDILGVSIFDQNAATFISTPARFSPRCFWPMRSTGPLPKPRARCWRPWRNSR
jgi:MoxR-like ATPase